MSRMMRELITTRLSILFLCVLLQPCSIAPTNAANSKKPPAHEDEQLKNAEKLVNEEHYSFCRNENVAVEMKNRRANPKHFCRLSNRNRNPILLFAPVKEEILSYNPLVIFFHDIITPKDIRILKQWAGRDFFDANVVSKAGTHTTTIHQETRKTKVAWVDTVWLSRLTKRIEAYTSLNPFEDGSERYQVAYYEVGGHYIPHYDMLWDGARNLKGEGDRLATMLIYLHAPEKGGGTVFPELKMRIAPKKGGALFWFNMQKNETYIMETLHAACPVLRGEKWAVNKWFRFRGQMLHKPCGLKADEPFTLNDLILPKSLIHRKSKKRIVNFDTALGTLHNMDWH